MTSAAVLPEPVAQARRLIHDDDAEGLQALLAEHPELLAWQRDADDGGLLGFATGAYGDAGTPEREAWFTRAKSAALLIEEGAVITPHVTDGLLMSRAHGLLALFDRRGLLPRTLEFHAALGRLDDVKQSLDSNVDNDAVTEAFVRACNFGHDAVASVLLERLVANDPELGERLDGGVGRPALVRYFIEHGPGETASVGPWKAFVMQNVMRTLHEGDLSAFVGLLQDHPWLLGDEHVVFQHNVMQTAAWIHMPETSHTRSDFISALLGFDPAILHHPPPPTQAIEHAITYRHTEVMPLLTRIWPLPDDLPTRQAWGSSRE